LAGAASCVQLVITSNLGSGENLDSGETLLITKPAFLDQNMVYLVALLGTSFNGRVRAQQISAAEINQRDPSATSQQRKLHRIGV
jgi:hypothetical protein